MEAKYEYEVDGITYTVVESEGTKKCDASDGSYHYVFDKRTGEFSRWGKTEADDPQWLPAGPEILDLEVSSNFCTHSCKYCYKGNDASKKAFNMTFETFKTILEKMPKTLMQIAYGVCNVNGNPDFFKMMNHARANGIIPNFTLADRIDASTADKIAAVCGATAVSVHQEDKNLAYDTIKMLTDRGMTQVNIHAFLSSETYDFVKEICQDFITDSRLEKMNAIVFLGVKPKGKAKGKFHPVKEAEFGRLVEACLSCGIRIGFDSCSCNKFQAWVEGSKLPAEIKENMMQCSEPCESFGMFSSYINDKGFYFPCSFCEGEGEWVDGIDVVNCGDFTKEVWNHPLVDKYRKMMIETGRKCPIFEV
jgi:organic radical activating enzyme